MSDDTRFPTMERAIRDAAKKRPLLGRLGRLNITSHPAEADYLGPDTAWGKAMDYARESFWAGSSGEEASESHLYVQTFALELLAPSAVVRRRIAEAGGKYALDRETLSSIGGSFNLYDTLASDWISEIAAGRVPEVFPAEGPSAAWPYDGLGYGKFDRRVVRGPNGSAFARVARGVRGALGRLAG